MPAEKRAEILFRAASLMRQRKFEIVGADLLRSRQIWTEADADTAETIDFLEFYGREMLRLAGRTR